MRKNEARVHMEPLPELLHPFRKFWPMHAPIFKGCWPGGPTETDYEVAREIFKLMDPKSQEWYRICSPGLFGDL